MNFLDHATDMAKRGFHVFPLCPNTKLPAIKGFPVKATYDLGQLRKWWGENPQYNIGISTSRFNGSQAVLAVDVDDKDGRAGSSTLLELELEGHSFPDTLTQKTPSGGKHLLYRVPRAVRQGVDVLGRGLDIRSSGGYVVGKGSILSLGEYILTEHDLAEAPPWLIEACGRAREKKNKPGEVAEGAEVDSEASLARARRYLLGDAPKAIQGSGGNQTTYRVACKVRGEAVSQLECLNLLFEHYNKKCEPEWSYEELGTIVDHAYQYAKNKIGEESPQVAFDKIEEEPKKLSPVEKMNREFAYIGEDKGYVLHETKNEEGVFTLNAIQIPTFHQNLIDRTMTFGGRVQPISKVWLSDPKKRYYDGLCFLPRRDAPKNFYNLWRDFSVKPSAKAEHESLDLFLEHSLKNICHGDEKLHHWLMTYLAHMVQRPWEKPQIALVMRGKKGVGKNVIIETVGHLFGTHFGLTADSNQVLGRFNSLLENKIMLVLDEAFWSGDKSLDGKLKHLITGEKHNIERKGIEAYPIRNCLRVVVLGNDDWVIPASADERRYAVFDVGEGRIQDRNFFKRMVEGMKAGGYSHLLRYLMDFDISKFEIGEAPLTEGLLNQKQSSQPPTFEWWMQCLMDGAICGEEWPDKAMSKSRVREDLLRFGKEKNQKYLPSDSVFSKQIRTVCPSTTTGQNRIDRVITNTFRFPDLAVARLEWEKYIGHKIKWPSYDEGVFD